MRTSLPSLRHLRLLPEVARHGSVSGAAQAVHLTQPAVTQAVAALERELGTTLFERSGRGMALTYAGRIALHRVDRALDQLRDGVAEARRGLRGPDGDPLRAITTAQLEALVAVVGEGAFGRAARARGVSRATVHRAARQLELAVGATLFESTSHGVRPTREAERLARRTELAAAELAQARSELAALAGDDRGQTVIGAMPLARSVIVPKAVLEFAARRPSHAVSILDGPYESMLEALRRGRADVLVGALRDGPPDDVVQEHLFDDRLAVLVRAGHPLVVLTDGGRSAVDVQRLAAYAWIAPRHGSPLRRQYEQLSTATGALSPVAPIECNSLVAARALLLASDRVMLLSAHQAHHEIATGQLVALPHPNGPVVRPIGLTVRRDWQPTPVQAELLASIRRVARDPRQVPSAVARPPSTRKRRGDTPMRRVKKRLK